MATIIINGTVTMDETSGLQDGTGVFPVSEDNNDNDVLLATLQVQASAFYHRLFTDMGLDAAFALNSGAAKSADNFISVSGAGSTITSLGFSDAAGDPLLVYDPFADPTIGLASGLTAVDGGAIYLFADPSLGDRMVLGVDADGDIVFAVFLEPTSDLTSAKVWMVQFEALSNPVGTNPDDPIDLTASGLNVAVGSTTEFDFGGLPSGQNLFGVVGDPGAALVVIGKTPVLKADGTFTNTSNTINTSQGGGPTTIGVNNQMFDPGEGAYFTFVTNPGILPGAGLDSNSADDADNIDYGSTLEVDGAFLRVSQIQGNSLATIKLTAYDVAGTPQERTFVSDLGDGTVVNITAVRVYNALGVKLEDTADLANFNSTSVVVTFTGGVATVSGVGAGYKIEWDTTALHDQVLVEGVAGKFDIGGFGVNQPSTAKTSIGQALRFEDDGPSITASAVGAPELVVDETVLATNAAGAFAAQFSPIFGADGAGATPVSYALSTPGGDSGLVDTATGQAVILSLVGGQVQGRTATSNDLVFTVSVDGSGNVTLDQIRAVVHPTADPDESNTLSAANLVALTATATDKDGDHASAPLNIGQLLVFKDDGPSITASAVGAPELVVDETVLATNAAGAFAAQFSPIFGADGAGATPVSYALSTPGGDSGLVDTATGQAVILSLVGGQVQGRTATSNDLVFTVSVDGSGNVTLDQIRAVVHPTADPDESNTLSAANLVALTATATDKDGDHASAPLNIGRLLVFKDDGPDIGPVAGGAVDFTEGQSLSSPVNAFEGADGADATISNWTQSIVYPFGTLISELSSDGKTVTWFSDNGDSVLGAGDTTFFTLEVDDSDASALNWDYTFTVHENGPQGVTEFDFGGLPSGQNLFGVVGDPGAALVVIGKTPVLKADGTFTNTSNTINTSQGGGPTTIGVNNQMFDPGEGAYFTFVTNPGILPGAGLDSNSADDADNIDYGSTLEVDGAFLRVSQIQGNSLATIKLTAYDVAGTPQERTFVSDLGDGTVVNITAVRVYNALGVKLEDTADLANFNSTSVVVTFTGGVATVSGVGAGYKIEWDTAALHDQVLVEGVAGKFDIGGFGFQQGVDTPDKQVFAEVTITDGDDDSDVSNQFTIDIDGNHDGLIDLIA